MKKTFLENGIEHLVFQRNVSVALTFVLSASLLVESCFLFSKQERIIVTPPVIEKEFWVDGRHISPTYLEQMGVFLGQSLLGKSAASCQKQRDIILRHCSPLFSSALRERLLTEEALLKKQGSSYMFYLSSVSVDTGDLSVVLRGDRKMFISGKEISSRTESYQLQFIYTDGRLLFNGLEEFKNQDA